MNPPPKSVLGIAVLAIIANSLLALTLFIDGDLIAAFSAVGLLVAWSTVTALFWLHITDQWYSTAVYRRNGGAK